MITTFTDLDDNFDRLPSWANAEEEARSMLRKCLERDRKKALRKDDRRPRILKDSEKMADDAINRYAPDGGRLHA